MNGKALQAPHTWWKGVFAVEHDDELDDPFTRSAMRLRGVVIALVLAFTFLVAQFSLSASADVAPAAIVRAVAFAAPVYWLAQKGHFGTRYLAFPTTVASLFVMWQLFLAPSMVTSAPAIPPFVYSSEAVTIGNIVYFLFWCVYVAACGDAPKPRSEVFAYPVRETVVGAGVLLIPWAVLTIVAFRRGLSNPYDGMSEMQIVGGSDSVVSILFLTFTYVIPGLAILLWRTRRREIRLFAVVIFVLAAATLFGCGGRRPVLQQVFVCVSLLSTSRARLRLSTLAVAISAIAAIMVLLFAYRVALSDMSSSSGITGKGEAILNGLKLLASPESRKETLDSQHENVHLRMAYSPELYTVMEYSLTEGQVLHGTLILDQLALIAPSKLVPKKTEIWLDHEVETALMATGYYPDIDDLAPTPILHFVFEFGWWAAPLGALVYAWVARAVDSALRSDKMISVARWVILGSIINALFAFEGPAFGFINSVRDPIWISLLVIVLVKLVPRDSVNRAAPESYGGAR